MALPAAFVWARHNLKTFRISHVYQAEWGVEVRVHIGCLISTYFKKTVKTCKVIRRVGDIFFHSRCVLRFRANSMTTDYVSKKSPPVGLTCVTGNQINTRIPILTYFDRFLAK